MCRNTFFHFLNKSVYICQNLLGVFGLSWNVTVSEWWRNMYNMPLEVIICMKHTWFPTYPLLNSGSFPVFPVSINGTNIYQEPQVENQSMILAFSLFLRPASFPLASPANLISNSLPTQIFPLCLRLPLFLEPLVFLVEAVTILSISVFTLFSVELTF